VETTAELRQLPTLSTGPLGELKVSTAERRVWLNPELAPLAVVTVQELIEGRWHATMIYSCSE
jgi:hypothetical protein